MSETKVTTRRLERHTPATTTSIRIEHRWGTQLGDTREYAVSRTGKRARIYSKGCDLDIPVDVMKAIAEAVLKVIADQVSDD